MEGRDKVIAITGAAGSLGRNLSDIWVEGARVVAADFNDCAATLNIVSAEGTRPESVSGSTCEELIRPLRWPSIATSRPASWTHQRARQLTWPFTGCYGAVASTSSRKRIGMRCSKREMAASSSAFFTDDMPEFFGDEVVNTGYSILRNLTPSDTPKRSLANTRCELAFCRGNGGRYLL